MNEPRLTSFEDLYQFAQSYRAGRWVFRGVARATHTLVPKVGRPGIETTNEKRIYEFFVREAVAHVLSLPSSHQLTIMMMTLQFTCCTHLAL